MPISGLFRAFSPHAGQGMGREKAGQEQGREKQGRAWKRGTLVKLICLTNKPVQSVNRQGKQAGRAGRQANREKAT